ncbi:Probable mediator of RNA polymerase II transcription subunit 26b [Striga hermonthica]|uniref:Probable mediator of RNA polymerase II transcription subunit 26b n=1 Tax=Striga hermonthica TaxID=68872 RepID=A0A9N7NW82_STRHE|nr:Probable mediator of RNA polymerase II transcription subunit 26b [Striga hermonthica]
MAKNTSFASLDKWRDYFRTANSDIFDIIEKAIMVAASDCPYDFKMKRDSIAELLFACKITRCFGCERLELAVPGGGCPEKSEDKYKSGVEAGGSKDTKESKVNSSDICCNEDDDDVDDDDCDDVNHREVMEMNVNRVRDDSYGDVEALNDEIEEESQFYGEVLRIKDVLDNHKDESDSFLFDSLRKLQLMPLSVETLKATEIGKSVNIMRKHGSAEIRNLARSLIEEWKIMVDSWVDATKAIADAEIRPESVKTSVVEDEEEEGLPSPPLDEGAFFTTPTSMELSQQKLFTPFSDPRNCGELNKNRENGRNKPNVDKTYVRMPKIEQCRNRETVLKKPSQAQALPKPSRPLGSQRGPVSVHMKLEVAKRKLQERYQEAENAKKQRTIQVVELRDLPKQSVVQRNPQMRPGNHNNRNWASGRR